LDIDEGRHADRAGAGDQREVLMTQCTGSYSVVEDQSARRVPCPVCGREIAVHPARKSSPARRALAAYLYAHETKKKIVRVELKYVGNSFNCAAYVDTIDDDVFVEITRELKSFTVRLKRWNAGGRGCKETGKFNYTPKTKPAPGNLPTYTANRIVNAWLKEQIDFELGANLLVRTAILAGSPERRSW
jgi:hypothetical protein